uniref:BLOC-1-related complex subunit 6 C-terminal helix domain-containing protein n=1 Tax=Panstrongylus lignarius TaxID=156445 RepID=A0A224XUG9_9HEMI
MTASYTEISESAGQEEIVTPRPTVLELPSSQADFLNQLDGTVTRHGDMISFVAGDLEAKIKLSSPPATSRQEQLLFGQVTLVEELEAEACVLAASVDSLAEALSETLHGISALTVDCLETYRDVVCKACDSIDNNIKAMYQLMAKCEEMSKSMQHVHKLAAHIKNIKHLLDMFEALPG